MEGIRHWRYQRFHISYLLAWLALGILLGLVCATWLRPAISTTGLIIFVLLCIPMLRSRRWWIVGVIALLGVTVGIARGADYLSSISGYDAYMNTQTSVEGRIVSDPQDAGKSMQAFQIDRVTIRGKTLPGELYISTSSKTILKRGDTLRITGKLKPGFATYQGAMSYATVSSLTRHPDLVRDVREHFTSSVRSYVVEPMASLGIGFVVGQRTALPPDLDEQLKIVGLTHIVVASGYNLTILVRFARRLLARHSRYLALVLSLVLMLTFVAFSGLSPSMNRAVAVTGLSLIAWYYGRRFHPLLLIGYVAAGTAMINPVYVWADLGWYLSFFAFAGVLIIAPLIATAIFKEKQAPAFAQLVLETLSAELMTLPLIALVFGIFPTFGLLANILVGPLIPFAMVATALAGLAGMLLPIAAPVVAMPASVIIGYVVAVVEWLAGIEWAQLPVVISLVIVVCWFSLLLVLSIYIWRRYKYNFRSSSITD
jgi:competence protein ComEC